MRPRIWILLIIALVIAVVVSLVVGPVPISFGAIWDALHGAGDAQVIAIIQTIRLPRVALGIAVGAGLSVSGVALQATLRNPLAEPYLLGVSGGAAVGTNGVRGHRSRWVQSDGDEPDVGCGTHHAM